MLPIWKDYEVQLTNTAPSEGVQYRLKVGLNVFFEGRAFAKPGASVTKIRVNDIIASQLTRGFTPAGETDVPCFSFTIEVYSSGSWSQVGSGLYFNADWSYDPDFNVATDPLNAPISDILLPGQLVPATRGTDLGVDEVVFRVGYVLPSGDFNPDFNQDFLLTGEAYEDVTLEVGPCGTAWLDLMDYPTAVSVQVLGKTYRVGGGSCNKHAFYYVNAYGGWDTLVVQGKTRIVDALTRHNTDKVYDNHASTSVRGTVNYVNEIARKFTFNTAPMPDASSLKMHHLLNTPHVLVHDTVTGHIWPLVLTGTATEHKHGGRLYSYAIEATLAQQRIRR